MRCLAFLLLSLLASPAMANTADVPEYRRLSHDLSSLASRNAWTGVDRTYRSLEQTGAPLNANDHFHGGAAARELGDLAAARTRLAEAAKISERREVVELLWQIDQSTAPVELTGHEITPKQPLFSPSDRRALEFANGKLTSDGAFEGLLPAGAYELDGLSFEVVAGERALSLTTSEPTKRRRR